MLCILQIADFGLARPKAYQETLSRYCVFTDFIKPNLLDVCGTVSYLPPEGILAMDDQKLGYVSTGMPMRLPHEQFVPGWDAVRLLECWSDPIHHARVRRSSWPFSPVSLTPLRTGATTPSIFREDPLANPGGPPIALHRLRRPQSPKCTLYPRIGPDPNGNLPRPLRKAKAWSRSAS